MSKLYNLLNNIISKLNAIPAWAKEATKPTYTASEVGADPENTASSMVSEHNVNVSAHNDIRLLISDVVSRINAIADSDDTTLDQLSEIVTYIKNNKSLIDSITTSKVSITDIIDNLTTNVSNKPLSAAQGVALKALIDAITIPTSLPANGGNADTVDNYHGSDLAKVKEDNTFDGEQKYINSSYAPTVTDSASGVGCAFKASRGLYNEALLDKIIMTASTGKIPFYKYTGTDSGQMTGLTEVSSIDSNGKYNGDADTIDGYHIRTASKDDTGLAGYITFIV